MVTFTKLRVKHFAITTKNFSFNQFHKQRVLFFFSSNYLCYKNVKKPFSLCVHNLIKTLERLGEKKPETKLRVCITVSNLVFSRAI